MYIVRQQDVPGSLAARGQGGLSLDAEWNSTFSRLDSAGAPRDELLDYVPNNIAWVYEATQWNNSWSFECQETPNTPIKLHDTGDCTNTSSELPDLDHAFGGHTGTPPTTLSKATMTVQIT